MGSRKKPKAQGASPQKPDDGPRIEAVDEEWIDLTEACKLAKGGKPWQSLYDLAQKGISVGTLVQRAGHPEQVSTPHFFRFAVKYGESLPDEVVQRLAKWEPPAVPLFVRGLWPGTLDDLEKAINNAFNPKKAREGAREPIGQHEWVFRVYECKRLKADDPRERTWLIYPEDYNHMTLEKVISTRDEPPSEHCPLGRTVVEYHPDYEGEPGAEIAAEEGHRGVRVDIWHRSAYAADTRECLARIVRELEREGFEPEQPQGEASAPQAKQPADSPQAPPTEQPQDAAAEEPDERAGAIRPAEADKAAAVGLAQLLQTRAGGTLTLVELAEHPEMDELLCNNYTTKTRTKWFRDECVPHNAKPGRRKRSKKHP